MNFKILNVFGVTEEDNDAEEPPFNIYVTKRGFRVFAKCLQDERIVEIFVPYSQIRDMEEIKTRLKRRYERDVTEEHERREREAQQKIQAIEEKVSITNLIGVIIDP